MYGLTLRTFQTGRVDHRGLATRRMISVREGERRAIRAYLGIRDRTRFSTRFLRMCEELRSVHTLGSLYLRTHNVLVVE